MATETSVHYVLIMEVQKITKTVKTQPTGQRWEQDKVVDSARDVSEVSKIVIRDKKLGDLIERGIKHLDLVTDEG